ncbi:hypothetical protein EAI_04635, partial [Harpegnathos saltator]
REIAEMLGISKSDVEKHLHQLDMVSRYDV